MTIGGLGAVSGYGWGRKLLWDGLYSAEPAVRRETGFAPAFDHDWGWVSRIEDGGDPADGPDRFMRSVRFAAREAVHDALDRGWRPGPVVGLVHSIVLGDVDLWRDYHQRSGAGTTRRQWLELMPSTVLMEVMREFQFHGPAMAVSAMCASSLSSLLTARMWITAGMASDVLVVATDLSTTPENCRSFATLGPCVVDAHPFDACRPFQEGSRGFCAGEASVGMLVTSQRVPGHAVLRGGAMTHDAYHPVSIPSDAEEVRRCFALALADAGCDPADVRYLNAHGPGTAQCDAAEAAAFDQLFPEAEGLFSVKPLVGHCQGASGAIELTASLFGFATGVIPAPPRRAPGHPKLLDGPTAAAEGLVVKSSLGMGGHNAVVVVEPSLD